MTGDVTSQLCDLAELRVVTQEIVDAYRAGQPVEHLIDQLAALLDASRR